jgi:hypothetical protein
MLIVDTFFPSDMNFFLKYFLSFLIFSQLLAILLWMLMSVKQILEAKKKIILNEAGDFLSNSDNKLNHN